MGTWTNNDGLHIKYGTDEVTSAAPGGEMLVFGPERVVEVKIELADLTATETIMNDTVFIPDNAQIMWVETVAEVAAATGTAIDVGVIKFDRSTEGDYNGFLAAFETGDMDAVGETRRFYQTHTVPASITGTGALVGEIMTYPGYISASRTDATAFTAGQLLVRIAFRPSVG